MQDELSHPARVNLIASARYPELVQIVKERSNLKEGAEDSLFFWRAEISNDLLDSHFTHMSESTLTNYAADAERGVAFLRGHNWTELPIGYSVGGQLEKGTKNRVVADFYTVRGMSDTDDLIGRMENGLVRDVSVGFHGGRALCDLCGQEFFDCRHFPGLKYEEKEGETVRTQLATFTIEDARLSEVSAVFDGSTPEAMILKAERAAKNGDLTPQQIDLLEQRYRIALPHKKTFAVTERKVETMTVDAKKLNQALASARLIPEESHNSEDLAMVEAGIGMAVTRIKELEPQAEEGRQYRKDLVAEALAEGVRAHGNEFDQTAYEGILKVAPLATIKRMRDDWKKTAEKILPAGRATTEGDGKSPKGVVVSYIPDEAFR